MEYDDFDDLDHVGERRDRSRSSARRSRSLSSQERTSRAINIARDLSSRGLNRSMSMPRGQRVDNLRLVHAPVGRQQRLGLLHQADFRDFLQIRLAKVKEAAIRRKKR